jgi:hypothetical protein
METETIDDEDLIILQLRGQKQDRKKPAVLRTNLICLG